LNLIKRSLKNAVINILRNKIINFLCLGIIAFTLLTFGIFNFVSHSLDSFTRQFSKNIEAIFYFRNDAERDQIDALIAKIRESLVVEEVIFISKNQAETNFSREFPELQYVLSEFDTSPFPASIEVKFKLQGRLDTRVVTLIEDIERLGIVESKQVNLDWANKVLTYKRFLSFVGIFLSSILIFISSFIIYNVIKLNIFYRKEEINILKLVGATDGYIRFPFIIEGGLLGLSGSLLSSLLLYVSLKLLPHFSIFDIEIVKEMIDFSHIPSSLFGQIIFLGTAIGLLSSFFSTKKFLKH
jgi:cell division transport system permease protein